MEKMDLALARRKIEETGRLYELLTSPENTIEVHGRKLHRIRALCNVRADVSAGDIGGYIEKYDNLLCSDDSRCWVYGNAKVFSGAVVQDRATVHDKAIVCASSKISGSARISGHALVHKSVYITDNVEVYGGIIRYDTVLTGEARVGEYAVVEKSKLDGHAAVRGHAHVEYFSTITGDAVVDGHAQVSHSTVRGKSIVTDHVSLTESIVDGGIISSTAHIYRGHIRNTGEVAVVGPLFPKRLLAAKKTRGLFLTFFPSRGDTERLIKVRASDYSDYDDKRRDDVNFKELWYRPDHLIGVEIPYEATTSLDALKKDFMQQYGSSWGNENPDAILLAAALSVGYALEARLKSRGKK